MWSLGCILAEMYTGYPIFPGENEQEQLACIMEVLGVPDKYLVDRSSRKKLFFGTSDATSPLHALTSIRRLYWCPATGDELERSTQKSWSKDFGSSSQIGRRALCRFYCEMPRLGS